MKIKRTDVLKAALGIPQDGAIITGANGKYTLAATAVGVLALLGTFTSGNLRAALGSGESTGTSAAVFADSPTLTTPMIDAGGGKKYGIFPGVISANRAMILPAIGATDTFVAEAFTQTLTNKTISGASNALSNIGLGSLSGLAAGMLTFLGAASSANLAAAMTDETGTGSVVFSDSPTVATQLTLTRLAIGTTQAQGIVAQTTTAAALGAQQYGPMISSIGQGWDSVAGTSKPVEFGLWTIPVQQAGTPTGTFRLGFRSNNGGWFIAHTVDSLGNTTSGASLIATTSITAQSGNISASNGTITATKSNLGVNNVTQGLLATNTQASTSGAPVQNSPGIWHLGSAYNSTSGLSENQEWWTLVAPVSAAGTTSSALTFYRRINGSSTTPVMTIDTAGKISAMSSGSLGAFVVTQPSTVVSLRDGFIATTGGTASVGVPVQCSPASRWTSSVYNSTSTLAEVRSVSCGLLPTSGAATGFLWKLYIDQNDVLGGNRDLLTVSEKALVTLVTPAGSSGAALYVSQGQGAVSTDAAVFANTSAATAGTALRYSGRSRWQAQVWQTTTPVTEVRSASAELRPVSGATTSFNWVLFRDVNDVAGALDLFTVSSAGLITATSATFGGTVNNTGLFSSSRTSNPAFLANGTGAYFQALNNVSAANATGDAFLAQNSAAATSGNQRYSSATRWSGTGFGTTAGTSQAVDFRAYNVPVQGLVPSGELTFDAQINAGGYATLLKLLTNGGIFIANDTVDPATPTAGGVLYVKAGALRFKGSAGTDTLVAAA